MWRPDFPKGAINTFQWRKDIVFSTHDTRTRENSFVKKPQKHVSNHHTNTDSKSPCITDLNVKPESIALLKENTGDNLMTLGS